MQGLFTEGKLRSYEQMMRQPTGYSRRGGGRRTGYTYTAEDVDCRYCLHYGGIVRGCKIDECVCIEERIATGALPKPLRKDIYRNDKHKAQFEFLIESGWLVPSKVSLQFLSAIFLLSSDKFLWNRAKKHITSNWIDFRRINIKGIGLESYAIWGAAKELCCGEFKISLFDLADREIISESVLPLIVNAMMIRRYGAGFIKTEVLYENNRYS